MAFVINIPSTERRLFLSHTSCNRIFRKHSTVCIMYSFITKIINQVSTPHCSTICRPFCNSSQKVTFITECRFRCLPGNSVSSAIIKIQSVTTQAHNSITYRNQFVFAPLPALRYSVCGRHFTDFGTFQPGRSRTSWYPVTRLDAYNSNMNCGVKYI